MGQSLENPHGIHRNYWDSSGTSWEFVVSYWRIGWESRDERSERASAASSRTERLTFGKPCELFENAWELMGNGIHEDLVRNFQGISGDLLGICTELIGNDWESHGERSERASGAIDVFGRCGSRSELT